MAHVAAIRLLRAASRNQPSFFGFAGWHSFDPQIHIAAVWFCARL
jgi:hypothetical protein